MPRLPARLERNPVAECVFEIRFSSDVPSTGELLPGMLFPHFKAEFPRLSALPASQIPKAIRQGDPELAYQAIHVLEGTRKRILLGERVAALSILRPYTGWASMEPLVLSLLERLKGSAVISKVERFSLRYTNIVAAGASSSLSAFNVEVGVGPFSSALQRVQLQAEIELNNTTTIVQLTPGAAVTIADAGGVEKLQGVMLVVDAVRQSGVENFLDAPSPLLRVVHETAREVFFGLLRQETISSLGPIWE